MTDKQTAIAALDIPEEYKLVSDFEIQAVWGNANFGSHEPRDIIADTLLKHASIYRTGHTATVICKELGLLGKNGDLTKKGRKYLYWSQETRVRKALQSKPVDMGARKFPLMLDLLKRIKAHKTKEFGTFTYYDNIDNISEQQIISVEDELRMNSRPSPLRE